MTDFTPGPWTIPTPRMGFSAISGGDGKLVFGLAAGGSDEKRPDPECDANARLIAAAPDLYEALRLIVEEIAEQEMFSDVRGWAISCKARAQAALAKASP